VLVAGEELNAEEVLRGESAAADGFALAQEGSLSVALDVALDEELVREGRARELIHRLNAMRKDEGLELTDRIVVTLGPEESDLLEYEDWIKEETLAVEVRAGDALAVERA
jgi:isoleucyl-tRNA synthetase